MKDIELGTQTRLKESEKRRFREWITRDFPLVTTSQLNQLVPLGRDAELVHVKLGEREDLYRCGPLGRTDPIFFTIPEKPHQLVPTCYSLHMAPQIVRTVDVYAGVDKKICSGANVFLPGIVRPDDLAALAFDIGTEWPRKIFGGKFSKGDLCAVLGFDSWAPCAVGLFAVGERDILERGMNHGTGVEVLHHQGDALWELGSCKLPSKAPPAEALLALEEVERRALEQQAAIEKAEAEKREAALIEQKADAGRKLKRAEKALRSAEEIAASAAAGVKLNADQKAKVERREALREEIAALKRLLEPAEITPPLPPTVDELSSAEALLCEEKEASGNGHSEGVAGQENNENEDANGSENAHENSFERNEDQDQNENEHENQSEADGEGGEAQEDDVEEGPGSDQMFVNGLFSMLSETSFPVLASEVFSKAARRCGVNIKHTSWKKASAFLSEFSSAIVFKEGKPGIVNVTAFRVANAPPFEKVQEEVEDFHEELGPARPVKLRRGGLVTVSERKVRGKNVTFIDGLDSWGFTKENMSHLAKDLRKRYSSSATVAARTGSESQALAAAALGKPAKKALWSVQVQGKWGEQVKGFLAEQGVDTVKVVGGASTGKKGWQMILHKQNR